MRVNIQINGLSLVRDMTADQIFEVLRDGGTVSAVKCYELHVGNNHIRRIPEDNVLSIETYCGRYICFELTDGTAQMCDTYVTLPHCGKIGWEVVSR